MTQTGVSRNLIGAVWLEREKNPRAKAADIARRLGKSRQAIRQALVKLGLPTKFHVVKFCEACGGELPQGNNTGRHQGCFLNPEVKDAIVRDYLRGDKTAVIQAECKIGPATMYRILHKRNVKLRREK